jgi:heme/copper-type cytochrome/quinol oxidase subunit 3
MASDPVLSDPLLASAGSHVAPEARSLNLRLGARLFVAADAFVFLAFLFAYLYLRALNQHGQWRPPHTSPSLALGLVTLVAVLGSAAAFVAALRALRAGRPQNWRAGARLSLALILVALVVQGWQLFDPGFSPYHAGAFGSVFIGFTATFFAHLLGATYWLETIVASSGLFHRDRAGVAQPSLLYEPAASAYGTFALFLAGVEIVAFVLIYIA